MIEAERLGGWAFEMMGVMGVEKLMKDVLPT